MYAYSNSAPYQVLVVISHQFRIIADAYCVLTDQHVGKRDDIKISKEEAAAAQDSFSHKCDFCNRKFNSRKAMLLHRNSCIHQYNTTEEVFTVEDIVGVFGWVENRWLLVKWEGYEEPD